MPRRSPAGGTVAQPQKPKTTPQITIHPACRKLALPASRANPGRAGCPREHIRSRSGWAHGLVSSGEWRGKASRFPHPAFRIPHSTFRFRIPHSAFRISAFRIPHSAFRIPHSAFRIPHSAFRRMTNQSVVFAGGPFIILDCDSPPLVWRGGFLFSPVCRNGVEQSLRSCS